MARYHHSFLALHCTIQCTESSFWHSPLRKMCKNHSFWNINFSEHKLGRFSNNIIWNQKYKHLRFFPLIDYFKCCTKVKDGYDYIYLSLERNKSVRSIECFKIFWKELFLRGTMCFPVFAFIVTSWWPLGSFLTWEMLS